ncbi:MAG: GAF domain-containing sensor histidine kinase [Proteobacteria bacterium]|nr:GAF domain-containing sensor histidine kinase [Pseudomonadota bacterium]MBU0967236.1 GAF domain-containing sensor histidine kinase [Pseudomonadota bacterium]
MEKKQWNEVKPDPQQCNRLLKSLFQITDVMNARKLTHSSMMDRVLQVVLDYLGVEQGSLMVLEKNKLVVRAASRPEIIGHKQTLTDDSVAAWVVRHAKPLFITDISQDKRFAKREGIYKKDSLLSAPVIHKDQVIGVINASDKSGGKDLLKDDISYLLYFSSFILWTFIQETLHKKISAQRNTLKKRNSELRHQEEMRSYLNRMLMHDLKTPLSEVVANLDILSYSISGEQKEFLEAAQLGCDRAVRMVANLVTTDMIADGKQQLLYEETDCLSLVGEAISSIKGLARIKGIDLLRQETAPDCPKITVDRTLMLRVLQNLLTNSLSYTYPDSAITVGFNMVGKNHIEFFVQDQGPGIPPAQQEYIFDKYARISSKQNALVGTGLGLHFCKLAVELHNGRIGVQSAEGKGSRFFFKLPIK